MPCFTDLTYAANPVEEVVIERDPHQPHILMARHPDTRLIIGMSRWIDAMSLLRKPPFSALSCYALTAQTSVASGVTEVNGAHIGRLGQLPVRARRHRRTPPPDTLMAMTVITIEGGFLLQEAAALERRLHEVARGGDYVVMSQTPSDPGLSATVLARAERWIGTLHWILPLLGCGILQEADDGWPQSSPWGRPPRQAWGQDFGPGGRPTSRSTSSPIRAGNAIACRWAT
jgi:hypothetical protein